MSTNKETTSASQFNLGAFLTKNSMTIALIVVFVLFYFLTNGRLLYAQNMSNLLLQNGYVLVMACGMLLCILTGGNIDLSVGSVICMVGGLAAVLITNHGVSIFLTIPLCIIVGLLAGIWQGYWIGYVRIPPFITTLGGMFIFRGFGRLILDSKTVSVQDVSFLNIFTAYIKIPGLDTDTRILSPMVIGVVVVAIIFYSTISSRAKKAKKGYRQNSALADFGRDIIISVVLLFYCYLLCRYKGISVMLVWVVAICLIYHFITSKTAFGRYFYAVGGNEKATKLSGINTNRVYFLAYANMGLLAGLAGILTIARLTSAQPTYGQNYEMDAIGSCFIGGASAYGGTGTVPGVIVGAVLMGIINLGMSIMGVDSNWQRVVKGIVLLLAVIFDVTTKKEGK